MMQPTTGKAAACRTCQGNGKVELLKKTASGTETAVMVCPACRGTGKSGYQTK
jgi:DnaJ-class molecular chaperone